MRRARSKKLAIMILFTFMATLFAAVPMASASASYSVVSGASKVTAGKSQDLGAVKVLFHMAELNKDSYLTLRLPTDFDFNLKDSDGKLLKDMNLGSSSESGEVYNLVYDSTTVSSVQIRIPQLKNAYYSQVLLKPLQSKTWRTMKLRSILIGMNFIRKTVPPENM